LIVHYSTKRILINTRSVTLFIMNDFEYGLPMT